MNTSCGRSPGVAAPSGSRPSGDTTTPATSLRNTATDPGCASGTMTALSRIAVFASPMAAARSSASAIGDGLRERLGDALGAARGRGADTLAEQRLEEPGRIRERRRDAVEVQAVERARRDRLAEVGEGHDVDGRAQADVRLELALDGRGRTRPDPGGPGQPCRGRGAGTRPRRSKLGSLERRGRRRGVELVPRRPLAGAGDHARRDVRGHDRARGERAPSSAPRGRGSRRSPGARSSRRRARPIPNARNAVDRPARGVTASSGCVAISSSCAGPGASIPSTEASSSAAVRAAGSPAQRRMTVGSAETGPGLRRHALQQGVVVLLPGRRSDRVPSRRRRAPPPRSAAIRAIDVVSRIASAGCATRARKAPSGVHSVNRTVSSSSASMRPSRPV